MKKPQAALAFSMFGVAALIACSCGSTSSSVHEHTSFSKADSLTDAYLVLSDSVLQSWNRIVGSEIDKSRTLQDLIDDLDNAQLLTEEVRESFQIRMEQLEKIRFTQETISDSQVVQDYDVALQAIIDDLGKINVTGGSDPKAMLKYLQESSFINRISYDSLARSFNDFIQKNKTILKDLDTSNELSAKPLFVKIK